MRLDRFLANSGVGTRKEVKEILKKRKIKVNDSIITDGSIHIDENKDAVKYEEKEISYKPFIYIMMNKPDGVISATEDDEHRTVIDLLENKYRTYSVFPIGRLDIDTEGLLILTNDGILTHNLLAPNKHVDKKYYVELKNPVLKSDIEKLENGIELENGFVTKNAKVEVIENSEDKVYITITEGKYHQVKRMFKAVNNKVLYLKRVQMGNLKLDDKLKVGKYRELTEKEINILKNN
ncbi:pseudouridine synthase [Pseudoleptotrichia goodfellowii]|uniref:Pseudouridine synthase n=2 Tax=Pseudoleptotrichia goodfellowii TaxID=157692 RepID=A0A510JAA4_9FUSO|nr:pseudouridine synthase [Pseudoleptotrichia goodfellowii]BBM36016.1 pseudouridine synthase [Pseudoleptotrichia goodfellowii]